MVRQDERSEHLSPAFFLPFPPQTARGRLQLPLLPSHRPKQCLQSRPRLLPLPALPAFPPQLVLLPSWAPTIKAVVRSLSCPSFPPTLKPRHPSLFYQLSSTTPRLPSLPRPHWLLLPHLPQRLLCPPQRVLLPLSHSLRRPHSSLLALYRRRRRFRPIRFPGDEHRPLRSFSRRTSTL